MKDSDQKEDYYSVSKQPPMPMGAPPPPPPMPMDPSMGGMPMPPMGGMPPGAPMSPQEEELQEGEYMDPATGKVMRRGEAFSVDPDRELDDPKNIAKWFDELKKGAPVPEWARPKSTAGELDAKDEQVNSMFPEQMGVRRHTQQNFADQMARDIGEGPNYPLAEGMQIQGQGGKPASRKTFGQIREMAHESERWPRGKEMKPTTRPTEPGMEQAQYDLDMEEAMQRLRREPSSRYQTVVPASKWQDGLEREQGEDASALADDFSRAGHSDVQDDPVYQRMLAQGYTHEELMSQDDWKKEQGLRGYGQGTALQPSWNKELVGEQQYLWDEDEVDQTREEQNLELLEARRNARQKPVEEERSFEDPFLQHKSWFREVMKP